MIILDPPRVIFMNKMHLTPPSSLRVGSAFNLTTRGRHGARTQLDSRHPLGNLRLSRLIQL